MIRSLIALPLAMGLVFAAGCTSKKYVRNETTPVINKTNELDAMTRDTTNTIKDVDKRSQQGIQAADAKAGQADQKAQSAAQAAAQAENSANQVNGRADQLQTSVANLDNYKPVVDSEVHFAFNSDQLSRKAKEALDQLASSIGSMQHFIVTVEGGADSVGSEDYNYDLSHRRAEAVIQYLEQKANIPAYRIYVIGLGKDHPAVPNTNAANRAKNRRVEVRLMTNRDEGTTAANQQPGPTQHP
ncbi:MAG: OmpA family protein [Acidobacteria bacterium]|nr:OmpA family protein [Acidobacteriota bacterium]